MELEDAKQSLKRYEEHNIPCGDFLTAVLSNDLFEAVGRADETSVFIIVPLVHWIYNNLRRDCWGDADTAKAWVHARVL